MFARYNNDTLQPVENPALMNSLPAVIARHAAGQRGQLLRSKRLGAGGWEGGAVGVAHKTNSERTY